MIDEDDISNYFTNMDNPLSRRERMAIEGYDIMYKRFMANGWKPKPVEQMVSLKKYDVEYGVDWIIETAKGAPFPKMYTIAARMCYANDYNDTFTIKTKNLPSAPKDARTDFQKKKAQFLHGSYRPNLVIQGYFAEDTKQMASLGIIQFDNLMYHVLRNETHYMEKLVRRNDGVEFIVIPFNAVRPHLLVINRFSIIPPES